MECPECQSTQTRRDCYNSLVYCQNCGLVLTASHEYVGGNKIHLPYGFRNGIHQCEDIINREYHAHGYMDSYSTETEHHEETIRLKKIK